MQIEIHDEEPELLKQLSEKKSPKRELGEHIGKNPVRTDKNPFKMGKEPELCTRLSEKEMRSLHSHSYAKLNRVLVEFKE